MLVIGIAPDKTIVHRDLEVDVDIDAPRKIHDKLKKETGGGDYEAVVCVENDEVVGNFSNGEDYDLTETPEDDESEAANTSSDEEYAEEDEKDDYSEDF